MLSVVCVCIVYLIPSLYIVRRGPGGFMPPWGMGPGPMPRPRGGGGSGIWHRGGRHGGGRGSATRPSQQYTGMLLFWSWLFTLLFCYIYMTVVR